MKISILIPVYNTLEYLTKCLNSILCQSFDNIEIIVVNDGSSDGSAALLEEYAHRDNRIVVIHQKNQGHQEARKTALEHATGNFSCFIDSDDSLPSKSTIETMVNSICDDVKIVVGRINIDDGNKQTLFASEIFETITTIEYTNYLLCGKVSWNLCGKLLETNLLKSVSNMPIKVTAAEDALYIISLASSFRGMVSMVNVPVYNYFVRPGSITRMRNVKCIYDNFKVANYIEEILVNRVEPAYLLAFRLLCLSSSFRYGWLGSMHPLYAETIQKYSRTNKVLPLFTIKKRLRIWILIHFGDFISRYVLKNMIYG